MSENKVVSRSVAVTLGVVCIILVSILTVILASYMQTIVEKDNVIKVKESEIAELTSQINQLQSQAADLQGEIGFLNDQLATLRAAYNAYMSAYQILKDKVNQRWNQINVEQFITPQD